ncbi:MAG: lysylphosphatidylglycerol synthase domain-containing protein [bacterium]
MMKWIFTLFSNPKFKLTYILILLIACVYYLFLKADKFYALANNANVKIIGLAFILIYLTLLLYAFISYYIYKNLNVSISYLQAFRIMSFSNLGKYIPGKIWVAGNYFLFSQEAGIKTANIGVSFAIFTSVFVGIAILFSIPVISILSPYLKYYIIILPIILILVAHPKVLNWIFSLIWQIVQKYKGNFKDINLQILKEIKYHFYLNVILIIFLWWLVTGFTFYLVTYAFQPIEITNLPFCIAAFALSATIGFIAIFVPAGIGVREGIGILLLSQIVTTECAFLAMLTMRLIGVTIDLCNGLISVFCIHSSNSQN